MQYANKPVVGMNMDFAFAKGDQESFSFLWTGYHESIQRAGGIPVALPPMENEADLLHVLKKLDGVLLIGGADLDPSRDGFIPHQTLNKMNTRRENFDRMLMRLIAENKIPVFGIGAGMQLMNVVMGGGLYFHIPVDLPKAMPHFDNKTTTMHRHTLDVIPGTIMERVYGDTEIRVNSRHHMAVSEVAPGFRVSACAPDGVIEAIESEYDDWFAMGTQFHPESSSATALDLRVFEEFIMAIGGVPCEFSLVA